MKQKSSFQFKDYIITKSLVLRGVEKSDGEFDIKINPSGIVNISDCIFQLTLDLKITDNTEQTVIQIEAIGFFSYEGEYENIKDFLFINAPAILYPYLRAYISSITSLSGLDTITIPTMNLSGMKDELILNTSFLEGSES